MAILAVSLSVLATPASAERALCGDGEHERARVGGEVDNACLLFGAGALGGESEFLFDDLATAFPVVYLSYGGFYWDTNEVGYFLLGEESDSGYWGVAGLLELPTDGFEVEDEDHLVGLDDREATLEGGVSLVGGGDSGNIEVGLNIDLEDEHDGYTAYAGYEYPIRFDELIVAPSVSACSTSV